MVIRVNHPASWTSIGISGVFGLASLFHIHLTLFVHFLAVGALIEKLIGFFAFGLGVVVNDTPLLIVAFDIVGIIRAEFDDCSRARNKSQLENFGC